MHKSAAKSMRKSSLDSNIKIRQVLTQADKLQKSGNLAAADRKYQRILKQRPDHVETLQRLAILRSQSGNSASALQFMQKALTLAPEDAQLLKNLAGIYHSLGDLEKAVTYAEKALSEDAQNVDALAILGAVYLEQDQTDKAIEILEKALKLDPGDVFVRHDMARALSSTGKYQNAVDYFQQALSQQPSFEECRFNLAHTLVELRDYAAAVNHYQKLLEGQPGNSGILLRMGNACELAGKIDTAVNSYESALQNDPTLIEPRLKLGKIFLTSEPEQSRDWFSSVLKIDPNYAQAHYWLGVQSQTMGKFEQATASLELAIKLQPDFSNAWYRLSMNRSYVPGLRVLKNIEQHFNAKVDIQVDNPELIPLGFTLGRFYEQRGAYDEAFGYFHTANQIKSRLYRFDRPQHDAQIIDIVKNFDSEFFKQRQGWGSASRLPVFIVGMPRSGTTLVEQVLAAHASVHGAGELQYMQQLVASLKVMNPVQAVSHAGRFKQLERESINQMAQQYLHELQALQPAARRILDKLPGNYLRLGIIFTVFPEARIIHCKRDPMDTCWSCYQQNFEQGLNFTSDLENLGHAYLGYFDLMTHWRQLFPDRILEIEYEAFLADPTTESKRMLKHCGLDWDPGVLEFAKQDRPVATASLWQVRQPLYKTAIGRWKNYRQYLQPLVQILSTTMQHSK